MNASKLQIALTPEALTEGSDCERVAFGRLEIAVGEHMLAALVDKRDSKANYQSGPYISGYHLAEWLVWNWWRLRWEPRSSPDASASLAWNLAHRMSDIGEGYLWPNITIACDGFQCDLRSAPSCAQDTRLFSYLGASSVTVPALELENAIDRFVDMVRQRLTDAGITKTNLQTLWDDLATERHNPEIALFRKMEALMGLEPDEKDETCIFSCLEDAQSLGESAVFELATGTSGHMLSGHQIADTTASVGFDMNPTDAVQLDIPLTMPGKQLWGQTAAWCIGEDVAKAVRQQAGQSDQPITNSVLANMAGIPAKALTSDQYTGNLSWVLHTTQGPSRMALRSRPATSRRFDVARLTGDRLFGASASSSDELLSPATRSYSYRQKAQRAFAAELLSPWEAVQTMLGDDYSQENQEHVAEHFLVSPLVISTLLMNKLGYPHDPHN